MGHHYFLSFCRHCLPSPVMNSLTFSTRTRSRKRQKNMRRPDIREVRARSITSSGRDLGFRTFRGAQTKSGRGGADAGDIWSFLHSGSVYCQRGRPLLLPCTTNSSVALAKHSDSSDLRLSSLPPSLPAKLCVGRTRKLAVYVGVSECQYVFSRVIQTLF